MRLVYLDESGTSHTEPVTVVAGVVVNPDQQWKSVERYIDGLINEYVPEEHRPGFVFHATELFHGSKVFDPRKYPPARRREALRKLIEIPAKFGLPTVYGFQDKWMLPLLHEQHPRRGKRVLAAYQAVTYSLCAIAVERFMREHAAPEELATLTVENNENARQMVAKVHNELRGKGHYIEKAAYLLEVGGTYLPVRKIIDCINFARKDDAILLQLADACAFVFRCFLEKKPNVEDLCNALTNNNPSILEAPRKADGSLDGYKILYFAPNPPAASPTT